MLLISKALSQLIIPPGGLILLGVVGLIFWKRRWGRVLVATSFALLWLLSTEPVRDALTSPLEFRYPVVDASKISGPGTTIVLLGGGIYENAPEYEGRDELNHYMMARTLYAAELALKTDAMVYATGGAPLAEDAEAEGSVMRRWLLRFGLPANRVVSETASLNTWENADYMQKVLSAKGVKRIVLVTSAWHIPRAVWCFRAHGFEVVPAPGDFLTRQTAYDLRSFLPSWTVLSDSGQALHEYFGLLWYRVRYG